MSIWVCWHEWEPIPPTPTSGPATIVVTGVSPTHRCKKCGKYGAQVTVVQEIGSFAQFDVNAGR